STLTDRSIAGSYGVSTVAVGWASGLVMMAVVDADLPATGLEALFRAPPHGLVRLAMVLTGDPGRAEELVQEAFVRFDPERVRAGAELPYLRRTVVNLSHSHH